MLANFKNLVKTYREEIMLFGVVFLATLLAFALIYIIIKAQAKPELEFIQ